MNDHIFPRKSAPKQFHNFYSHSRKISPPQSLLQPESRDGSANLNGYPDLVPMKGLTSTRSKPLNPLQVYYKSIDALKNKQEKVPHKVSLPQITNTESMIRLHGDETFISGYNISPTLHSKGMSSPYLNQMSSRKDLIEKEINEYLKVDRHENESPQKGHKSAISLQAKPSTKTLTLPGEDYADIKKKQEYENMDKRTRKLMGIKMQNYYHMKSKYMSEYLGLSAKAQAKEISSSFGPSFVSPRNEYPILG